MGSIQKAEEPEDSTTRCITEAFCRINLPSLCSVLGIDTIHHLDLRQPGTPRYEEIKVQQEKLI